MKHRSSVILILVVATLALVPQAAQRLEDFGHGVASRVEGAFWNTFLSLHVRQTRRAVEQSAPPVQRADAPLVASNATPTARKAAPRAESKTRRTSEDKNSFDAQARNGADEFKYDFALKTFAPLNLEAEQRVALVRKFEAADLDALKNALHGKGATAEREARRLLRTFDRTLRVNSGEATRRRLIEVGEPKVNVEQPGVAPELPRKTKTVARAACPAPPAEAPAPSPSTQVEAVTFGFNDH